MLAGQDTTGSEATGPREVRLLPQHRDVRQAVPARDDRGGQDRNDLARVAQRPRAPSPLHRLRQAPAQAGHPHRLPQQDRARPELQALPVRRHGDLGAACVILH